MLSIDLSDSKRRLEENIRGAAFLITRLGVQVINSHLYS